MNAITHSENVSQCYHSARQKLVFSALDPSLAEDKF
ncbi:hypothetical protein T4A_11405 [Trichinella pseudospiralis]|uniref:Uncharacterized protein n=1 Tax=Trichinella pseudospiralis TaxID=6337 RepID=A0A0V1DSG5_TRIPS|nr:hypothetical protein T4A_6505 [Trichinella pseudospiralis]KRY67225.1 hypothetical protein T4A_11405 [Trichinella pseudospiralis]